MWCVVLDEQHSLASQRVDRHNSKRGPLHADVARLARKSVSLALPREDGLTKHNNKSRVTIGMACCLAAFLLLSAMVFKIEFLPVGFFTPFVAFTGALMYFTHKQLAGGVQRSINSNHFEAQINSMNTAAIKELKCIEAFLLEAMTKKITAAIPVVQNEASKAMSDAQQSCTSIVDRIELLDQEVSRVLGASHITERLITLMLQQLGGARNSIIGSASLLMTRDLVADMVSAIPKKVRYAVLPRTTELVSILRLMDPRSREDLQGLQREQLRLGVNAVVVQYQSSTANLAAQRVQPLEHPLHQRDSNELQYDTADDDGSKLTPALTAHYEAHSLDALQLEVRDVYGQLYAKEDNLPTMEDVRVDRRELYMPPNVVRVASSTNPKTRSRLRDDSLIGASVENTDLLRVMIDEGIRALLAEGCTGIGKTFYCIMMALLQNLDNGIVILLRLSDISAYFGSRVLDPGATNQTLSPRELLYISFGCNPAYRSLVDRIYFRIRLGGGRIAWIIDGHNEVFRTTNVFVRTLLNAVARACNQTTNEQSAPVNGDDDSDDDGDDSSGQHDDGEVIPSTHQLFSSDDLIIVTSREQIASFVSKAAHVVVFNMWSPDTAVRFVRNVLALVVDASSAEALPSPLHNASVGGVSSRLLERAEAIIRGGSLGSFSTLPLWLTMVVVHVRQHHTTRNSSNDTITDLMKEFVQVNLAAAATRVEEFRTAMTHLGSDGVKLLVKRCMEKSVTTVEDGVFFVLDRTVPVESALYHSGLVRVCVRVHKMKPIVRFVHMSFLEYFRALYFAADLRQLWTWAVSNPIPSVASNAATNDIILHTSQDEINHFSSPDGDAFVDIPLACMRHIYSSIDVLWLEGARELLDFTKTRQNPLLRKYKRTFKWKNCENQIFCGLKNVRMVKGRDYYLVLRPSSGSAMVPICCTVPNNVIVKRAVPLVDIHGSRQQGTFFVLLTDLVVKSDAEQCLMLFSFLEARLAHHYGRAACFLSAPERRAYLASSQRIPVVGVVPQEGVYSSKLDDLGNMGMVVYMRCVKPLLSRVRRSFNAGLQAVRLASSLWGRLLEVVLGRSRKAIFEWALYPTIMVDCWEMWQELTGRLSENRWDKLKHLFPELLIAAMAVNNTLVADALKARGAQFHWALACKKDATNVILTHIRKVVAETPNMADQIFFSILVESLRCQKLTTAGAVMDELLNYSNGCALVANNMPMMWKLLLEPWSDRSNSNNNTHSQLPSSALHWLKRRLRDIPLLSHTKNSKTGIETMVLDTFHVRNIQHAVDAKIVTVSGLLSNPKPFLRFIEAMRPHEENAATPSLLWMQAGDCCSLREGAISVARISFCGFSERLLYYIFTDCCLSTVKSVEIDGCLSDVDNKRLCMLLSVATLDVLTITSSLIFDATVQHIMDHVSLWSLTLRHVHIEGTNVTLRSLLGRLTKVKHLAVCDTYGVSIDSDLQCVSSHVQQLDLSGMRGLSDSNIAAVVGQFPNVTSLNFTGCGELTDASVRSLQGLTTDATMLKTLNTEGCARISGDSLNALVEHSTAACISRAVFCLCPELEAEHQSTCRYAGEARAIPLQLIGRAFIQKVEHLLPARAVLRTDDASRDVDVSECVNFNDAALRNLIRSLQTEEKGDDITALTLRGTNVTDDSIDAMEALSGLTKLDITSCPITAQGLARIATNHPTLTFLDLSRCQQIDDREDLSAAIRRLPLLEELVAQNVRFRSLFTSAATYVHGLASLHHLTRLELRGYNDLVRDEPVIRTVCTLRKLRHVCLTEFSMSEGTASGFCQLMLVVHLDLTSCRISGSNAVFDNCVNYFMTSKLLKTLVLARCIQLTDAGVVLVTQHALLRALNIADTPNVTLSPHTIAAITASQLSSINVRNSGRGSVALAGLDERFSSSR
ncbi:transmembrane protein, putative [Bodo saltans]|uniref:Transmembrane protein, putative n=1 Tax=Bodo saltans TaxID=75058 RepID=A0A0S4J2D9_BODSA|nr:transmembrane protein, putative [Bodo saltans]|eukprot:CUG41943.1 transmembrane protein, putative [Bodo saltans]